jgi:hypothetical protein
MADENKQSMQGMKLTGDATQSSDQRKTVMSMLDVSARNASQKQSADLPTLEVFGWKGQGVWAVVCLVIIALAALAAKVFMK